MRGPSDEGQQPVRHWFMHDLFSRFSRLASRNKPKKIFDEQWSNDALETMGSIVLEQPSVVPMSSVRVNWTVDAVSTP